MRDRDVVTLVEAQAPERLATFLMELRARGIRDTVLLSACERAPRERFLRPLSQPYAYRDVELPIGCGQSAPSPFGIVRRLAALKIQPRDIVLEIGSGSGYQTALIGFCARRVVGIERYRALALESSRRLSELGVGNASVKQGDGREGLAIHGPFDAIVVNGGFDTVPGRMKEQLAAQGRILVPLGVPGRERWQLLQRTPAGFDETDLGPAAVLPLAEGVPEIL